MNKKIKIIISSIIVLITISISIIISITKEKIMTTNDAVSGLAVYVQNGTGYTATSSVPTGEYKLNRTLSHCINGSKINGYNASAGTINYRLKGADWCYIYFDQGKEYVSDYIMSLSSYDDPSNIVNNIAVDEHTDSSDNSTYYEYRYVGANPDNYACFSSNGTTCINSDQLSGTDATGALFRIIGVFDEHTHGQSGKQLVKLITADSLVDALGFDVKQGEIGVATSSSISTSGSNDWSDSQLMYMLNGSAGNNKGYLSLTPVYGTATPIRTLTYSDNNVYYDDTNGYYFYTNYNGNSYLSAGDGTTTSSRTLNKPAKVANRSNYSSSTLTVNSLVPSQTGMIKEVVWHLGGYSSTSITTSAYYTYERGSDVYSTNTTRPYTWIGKIGLMYLSDYGYATSGGTTYDRNACLTSYNLGSWSNYSDCYTNDWLLYPGARTGTQGTASYQWTISPGSSGAGNLFYVHSSGCVYNTSSLSVPDPVRPAFYLEYEVSIDLGDGTSTNPYLLTSDIDGKPEILNIIDTKMYYTLTAVATDDNGLTGYALSTSNTTAPTSWTSISGTTASITAVASTAGNYYLWVKDSSGQTNVTTNSYYLSYDNIKPTISDVSTSWRTLTATLADNTALAGYALSTSNTTAPTSWESISGTSYSLSYTASSNGLYYIWVKDSSGTTAVTTTNYGLYIFGSTNLVSRMQELVTLDPSIAASDIQGSYTNYRYVGANPNNYACFSSDGTTCINPDQLSGTDATGALFRIIGSFAEDTHGQSGEQLVKLITADILADATLCWDAKKGSTSAATSSSISLYYGSNDWSDSQLMYMLNGSAGNNKGYLSLTPVYGTATPIRTLTYSDNNVYYDDTNGYYFYTNYNGNSYLSAGDGTTTSSRTLNIPAGVANGSNYSSSSTLTVNSLVPSQTRMIKEVTWHLGGYSSTSITTSAYYTYERGTTVYSTNTTRPYTWIGKIGLMYPSDYGYATSGGTKYNRNVCLTSYNLGSWSSYSDCYTNDWLLYPGARTGTQGTATTQWTISPYTTTAFSNQNVYSWGSMGYINANTCDRKVRASFYLESSVYVAGGSGTSTDPYLLAMD